jgi:hypothetical protein
MRTLWPLCVRRAYASGSDACSEHKHQELMHSLSICVSSFCVFSNVHFVHPQHMHKELMHMLSMHVRNSFLYWAYASGTRECPELTHQELMCALSIHIRNSCEHWAWYTSRTMCALSILIRNFCVHWAYASGTYACTEYTHTELMRLLSTCNSSLHVCSAKV